MKFNNSPVESKETVTMNQATGYPGVGNGRDNISYPQHYNYSKCYGHKNLKKKVVPKLKQKICKNDLIAY